MCAGWSVSVCYVVDLVVKRGGTETLNHYDGELYVSLGIKIYNSMVRMSEP